jgi:hypothetical protein
MAEEQEPDSLVLRYLRRISAEQEKQGARLIEVMECLGHLEVGMASLSRRIDRIDLRLDRVEPSRASGRGGRRSVRATYEPAFAARRSGLRVLKGQLGTVIGLFTVVPVPTLWLVLRSAAKVGAWPA